MKKAILALFATILLGGANAATAGLIDWVGNWKTHEGAASGSFTQNGKLIKVTYEGHFLDIAPDSYWREGSQPAYTGNPVVDNAPKQGLKLSQKSEENILVFSEPVEGLVFAMYSVGRLGTPVSYEFDASYTFLGEGDGAWGNGSFSQNGNNLTGREGHGVIQFGSLTSLRWANPQDEFHHGFAIGAPSTTSDPVPEPATMLLFGSGMAGLVAAARRRKK